jgi:hypothetical protein
MDGARTHIWLVPGQRQGAVLLSNGTAEYAEAAAAIKPLLRRRL